MRMNLIRSLFYKQNKCNHNGNSTHICHFLATAPRAIIKTSSTRHLWTFLLCRHFGNVPKCRDLGAFLGCCLFKSVPNDWSFKNVPQ